MQSYAVRLTELSQHLVEPVTALEANPLVKGIQLDSRRVRPGDLFVALEGGRLDGHRFIPEAVAQGAVAVVGTHPSPPNLHAPYIQVQDGRHALAVLSAAFTQPG